MLDSARVDNLEFLLEQIGREPEDVLMQAFAKVVIKLNKNPKHPVFAMKSTGQGDALNSILRVLGKGQFAADEAAAVLAIAGDAADAAQANQTAGMDNDPALATL